MPRRIRDAGFDKPSRRTAKGADDGRWRDMEEALSRCRRAMQRSRHMRRRDR